MVRQLERSGMSHDEAVIATRQFIRSSSSLPVATPIDATDSLIKVVPMGGRPSATTGYWMSESEWAALRANPATMADRLGLPPGMQVEAYDVFQIRPRSGAVAFESQIARTLVDGVPNTTGGARQMLVLDRTQFTPPVRIDTITINQGDRP